MLPSLLARDVQKGLKNFLIAGFEPSDPLFAGIMKRFTENESRWMKGPYIQLGCPSELVPKAKSSSPLSRPNSVGMFTRRRPGNDSLQIGWRLQR